MPAPPSFSDLGKAARDVFGKGYNFGLYKLDVKTKTDNQVEFTVKGSSNHDTGKVLGSLETKYKCSDYGITLSETWNTDNTLGTEVTIEDKIAEGLKLAFDASFAPVTGKKGAKIKTTYKMDYLNTNLDLDLNFAGPTVHGAAVLAYNGWLAGGKLSFDTSKSQLASNSFALGYQQNDFQLNTTVNDGNEFGGSVYQRVNSNLETAVSLSWAAGTNATRFNLGAVYKLDKDATVRAKVDSLSQVCLAYTQAVRDGVNLTLSTMIDGKNFNAGGHKMGIGLEFEA